MKLTAIILILSVLIITGCTMVAPDNEGIITEETDSKIEAMEIIDEANYNSDISEDKEQSFWGMPSNTDIFFESDLEDGIFHEIPRLSEEKEAVFIQSNNCVESLVARLESYGVLLNPDIISEDIFISTVDYSFLPIFVGHYKGFDFIYVRYPGYRSYYSGNLYIFENSLLKKYIPRIGIDLENAFRTIGENTWLVSMQPGGGSGMAVEVMEWINLTDDGIPIALKYTNYYGQGNYRHGFDIDFSPVMIYSVSEEDLYINEQNIPVLKVSWKKEVFVDKDSLYKEKIISLIATGYDEYAIDASVDWEQYNTYDLSCGNLLDGFDEQLKELTSHGTEEEKNIAKQLIDNFATMPIA